MHGRGGVNITRAAGDARTKVNDVIIPEAATVNTGGRYTRSYRSWQDGPDRWANVRGPHRLQHEPVEILGASVTANFRFEDTGASGHAQTFAFTDDEYSINGNEVTITPTPGKLSNVRIRIYSQYNQRYQEYTPNVWSVSISYVYQGEPGPLRARLEAPDIEHRTTRINLPQIPTPEGGRTFMAEYLDQHKDGVASINVMVPDLAAPYFEGDAVNLRIDSPDGETLVGKYSIAAIKKAYPKGMTILICQDQITDYYEHDAEIIKKIHTIESEKAQNVVINPTVRLIGERLGIRSEATLWLSGVPYHTVSESLVLSTAWSVKLMAAHLVFEDNVELSFSEIFDSRETLLYESDEPERFGMIDEFRLVLRNQPFYDGNSRYDGTVLYG